MDYVDTLTEAVLDTQYPHWLSLQYSIWCSQVCSARPALPPPTEPSVEAGPAQSVYLYTGAGRSKLALAL